MNSIKFLLALAGVLLISSCVKSGGAATVGGDKAIITGQPQKSESVQTYEGDQTASTNGAAPLLVKVDDQGAHINSQGTAGQMVLDALEQKLLINTQADALVSMDDFSYSSEYVEVHTSDGLTTVTEMLPTADIKATNVKIDFNKTPQDEAIRDAYKEAAVAAISITDLQKQESVSNTQAGTDATNSIFTKIIEFIFGSSA